MNENEKKSIIREKLDGLVPRDELEKMDLVELSQKFAQIQQTLNPKKDSFGKESMEMQWE